MAKALKKRALGAKAGGLIKIIGDLEKAGKPVPQEKRDALKQTGRQMADIDRRLTADKFKANVAIETSKDDSEGTNGGSGLADLFETVNNAHDVDLDMPATPVANGLYDPHKQKSNDRIHECHCADCDPNFIAGILEQARNT